MGYLYNSALILWCLWDSSWLWSQNAPSIWCQHKLKRESWPLYDSDGFRSFVGSACHVAVRNFKYFIKNRILLHTSSSANFKICDRVRLDAFTQLCKTTNHKVVTQRRVFSNFNISTDSWIASQLNVETTPSGCVDVVVVFGTSNAWYGISSGTDWKKRLECYLNQVRRTCNCYLYLTNEEVVAPSIDV